MHGKSFVWQRPLNKADLKTLGDRDRRRRRGRSWRRTWPTLDEKDALVTEEPDVFFTIEHFTGFRAVLIRLDRIEVDRLEDVITDAWLVRAPKRLAADFLASSRP